MNLTEWSGVESTERWTQRRSENETNERTSQSILSSSTGEV